MIPRRTPFVLAALMSGFLVISASLLRSQAMMVSGPEGNWEYFALGVVWGADNLRRASPPTDDIHSVHEELYATPISLRRDSLAILGTHTPAALVDIVAGSDIGAVLPRSPSPRARTGRRLSTVHVVDNRIDLLVPHAGLTTAGTIGAGVALTLDEAIEKVMAMAEAAWKVRKDQWVMCHGGPFDEPQNVAYALSKMPAPTTSLKSARSPRRRRPGTWRCMSFTMSSVMRSQRAASTSEGSSPSRGERSIS